MNNPAFILPNSPEINVASELKLNPAERELVVQFVRQIRGDHIAGGVRRAVKYQECLEALWRTAYCEQEASERACQPMSATAEALDAAANIIISVMAHQPDIQPLLAGFGKKVQAARWRKAS
jgi:hypothetical protein